ncbi:MAG: winged helix-turn-helix domain-containing protein [Lachnospiraceae bacterium]|nr:winged helix-turn-helix domain-containing protein [Lachnospiraceae bacterium]
MKDKELLICAASDIWLERVISGLGETGITVVTCKAPEQLWEAPVDSLGILISLEEIFSLHDWLYIKDFYEPRQSQMHFVQNSMLETNNNEKLQKIFLIKNMVQKLCRIQKCPVFIVLEGREDESELACLQAGAAECVSMTQAVPLAIERIGRKLIENVDEESAILCWNRVILDRKKQKLQVGNRCCYLSGREYKVLIELLQARGEVVSRNRLATVLWGEDGSRQHRNLDAVMRSLRNRLKDVELEIATRYREGYYLPESMENN